MRIATNLSFLLIALTIGLASPAFAQRDDPKVRLTVGGGVTAGAIDGEGALNVSAGYRFSKLFSFDVEVVGIDGGAGDDLVRPFNLSDIGLNLPGLNGFTFPTGTVIDTEGNTVLSTVGFRFEFPTAEERFRPYVSGGLGMAHTSQDFDVRILAADTRNRATISPTSLFSDDHTGVAVGGGVGAMVRVWKGLSLGVDARYYRLDRGRNLGTFGGSVSYGF
jgi:hypothetical protein